MTDPAVDAPRPLQHWCWRGHSIGFTSQLPSPEHRGSAHPVPSVVVLIHGFGASSGHWRHNLPELGEHFCTYAIDLLGFGSSDKPCSQLRGETARVGAVAYGFDLWAEQVADFAAWILAAGGSQDPGPAPSLQLVGNSIGGVVALRASELLIARGLAPSQVILIDCAQRTLDQKRLALLPWPQRVSRPLIQQLVRQRWLIAPLFRTLARPAFIRRVLAMAYPSGANIDDALVELLFRPSTDEGAPESFRGFINLFDDHLAPEILARLGCLPVRMIWGELDPWENPAEARRWADQFSGVRELRLLPGLGHCPHDEAPQLVNPILIEWLSATEQSQRNREDPAA
ncbi:alpha/beta fold hydrolase [Synechococcus sp. RedBA-s]|uniref:alpha/beta fold hydrolase n=1 Tax=Synechococcus sp. RedBA-s TaxID=2823741 RepID=UPI0020CD0E3E|nr:alpha/beta fold hydrolase [Synechococcus sp. RedBA-s]